jgi:hypothetical protein
MEKGWDATKVRRLGVTHLHFTRDGVEETVPYIPGETEKTLPSGRVVAHGDPCPWVSDAMQSYVYS